MAKSGVSSYGIREKWEEAVSTAHADVKVFFTFSPSQSSPFVYLKVSTSLQPKPSFPPTSPPSTQRYFHYYQSLLHYNIPLCFSNNICAPSFPLPPHPLLPHTHSSLTPTLSSLSSSLHSPSSHPPHPHILSPLPLSLYTIFIPLLLPSIQQLNSLEVRSEQFTFVVHHLTMLNRLVIKLRMHMGLQH